MLRRLAFPVLFFGLATAGYLLIESGYDYERSSLGLFLVSAVAIVILQRLIPYDPSWNESRGELATDALYIASTSIVSGGTLVLIAAGIEALLSAFPGIQVGVALWPERAPLVLQVVLALGIAEVFRYAFHRVSHRDGSLLWRLHQIHHSARRVHLPIFLRQHVGEVLLGTIVAYTPLLLLVPDQAVFNLMLLLIALLNMINHANVDFDSGFWNGILATPEVHRWHHSRDLAYGNRNFGSFFILPDRFLGSYAFPREERLAADGVGLVGDEGYPRGYAAQLLRPFRREARQPIDRPAAVESSAGSPLDA